MFHPGILNSNHPSIGLDPIAVYIDVYADNDLEPLQVTIEHRRIF